MIFVLISLGYSKHKITICIKLWIWICTFYRTKLSDNVFVFFTTFFTFLNHSWICFKTLFLHAKSRSYYLMNKKITINTKLPKWNSKTWQISTLDISKAVLLNFMKTIKFELGKLTGYREIPLSCPDCSRTLSMVQYSGPLKFLKSLSWHICKYCKFVRDTDDFKKVLLTVWYLIFKLH